MGFRQVFITNIIEQLNFIKMNKLGFLVSVTAIMLLSSFTIYESVNWEIEEGYSIKFISEDPTGVFTKMSGDISFDADQLETSKFAVKVDVSSINTGNGMQNKHAKSDKWFDANQYPTINFTSQSFAKTDDGYEVLGTLEIHGVAKEFTMPFTFEDNVFTSSFTINRLEYNIGSTKGMSAKVPAELAVELSVPVSSK